ncbi:MAG: recombinase RecA [Alphaproteobacteria bacterium]|nr:recombinase RecA [Alphaproteobacteria bacterium]MCB9693146.1 recombinase RecA [Alphaproteobacteria bacterium]
MTEAKQKALDIAVEDIERRWGKGAVMRLGDRAAAGVNVIPSGSRALDQILGVGGYPRGRVVEIYGPESSGKTTLTLHAIAQCQLRGGIAAFVDAEHALDVTYAEQLGVDTNALLVAQPDNGEQALEITETLVRSGAVDLVVVDSVAALVPRAELEGDMGDAHVGLQARLMSQALRKITAVTARTETTVVFINQLRQKIGVMYGSNETTTGGNALKFYASVRIDIRRIGSIKGSSKEGAEPVGNRTRIRIVKNKLAPPFQTAEVEIIYGRGICQVGEVMAEAEERGLLKKSGSWYTIGDDRVGQGKENVRKRLLEDPALFARLSEMLLPGEPAVAK